MTKNTTPDFSRMTPQAVKAYHEGMSAVRKNLAKAQLAKAQLESHRSEANRAAVVKQMGSTLAAKCFGIKPAPLSPRLQSLATGAAERAVKAYTAPTRKPAPAVTRKAYESPQRTMHRYSVPIFG